jgi:hypothetical protein
MCYAPDRRWRHAILRDMRRALSRRWAALPALRSGGEAPEGHDPLVALAGAHRVCGGGAMGVASLCRRSASKRPRHNADAHRRQTINTTACRIDPAGGRVSLGGFSGCAFQSWKRPPTIRCALIMWWHSGQRFRNGLVHRPQMKKMIMRGKSIMRLTIPVSVHRSQSRHPRAILEPFLP